MKAHSYSRSTISAANVCFFESVRNQPTSVPLRSGRHTSPAVRPPDGTDAWQINENRAFQPLHRL
jgi:hypothetical protein